MAVPATPPTVFDPAHRLLGRELDGGWKVVELLERAPDATGGNFSVAYWVEHADGRRAFLKALDYSQAFRHKDIALILQRMTESYNFERRMLEQCARNNMSRIVRALDSGTVEDDDFAHVVNYLIFEPADGDVRAALDAMRAFNTAWALGACHDAAVGVQQLHASGLSHQDIKPSNFFTFGEWLAKLGDVGRASMRGVAAPHDSEIVRGDEAYAPPELLYGQVDAEWSVRCQACDLYLLGSLILFIFTRTHTTAEIVRRVPAAFHPGPFAEPYPVALPYVLDAFDEAADAFADQLSGERAGELGTLFRQLCHPDPGRRGDPIERRRGHNPYDLRRVITRLDVLAREARAGYLSRRAP